MHAWMILRWPFHEQYLGISNGIGVPWREFCCVLSKGLFLMGIIGQHCTCEAIHSECPKMSQVQL